MSTTFDRYPKPGTTLKFKNFRNVAKVILRFIFDFESFLGPIQEEELDNIKIKYIQEHIPSAFALHCISRVPDYQPDPIVRVKTKPNENMVKEFFDTIYSWVHKLHKKFDKPRALKMTAKEKYISEESNNC